jgi:predicted GNAT superfamily acetyltransferase
VQFTGCGACPVTPLTVYSRRPTPEQPLPSDHAGPPLVLRPLTTPADDEACVVLQRATWGDDFRELVPPALLQIARKMGGVLTGAWAGERLVGFVFGITGLAAGQLAHWSHMLAVDAAHRDRGIGRRLKEHQRTQVLAMGIAQMFWTFDPLVARNAHLNLRRLGARVVEYVRDMYGENPMNPSDSVIGSDRFVVRWDLRAAPREGGRDRPATGARLPMIASSDDPLPDAPTVLMAIPSDIQALKRDDPDAALAWRRSTRRALQHYLAAGFTVTDFAAATPPGVTHYVLERAG